jgi:hypothetical protein
MSGNIGPEIFVLAIKGMLLEPGERSAGKCWYLAEHEMNRLW